MNQWLETVARYNEMIKKRKEITAKNSPSIRLWTGKGDRVVAACCALTLLSLPTASAAEDPERSARQMMTAKTQVAIDHGLAFLQQHQREDGSFGRGSYRGNVAVSSLCGLAFLSAGSTPGRGPYGTTIDQCLDFVLRHVEDNGFIVQPESSSHGPMYGHGFATLFLAENFGMSPRRDLRDKLSRAVRLILDTQNEDGGWRYEPQRRDADLSVTVCQVMALRAASNGGIHVPTETMERSIMYVKRSQNADGGFMYMLRGGPSAFPRSAAGVVSLYNAGLYEDPAIERGLEYLDQFSPTPSPDDLQSHFFYGQYYAVQAMWQAGGDRWHKWFPAARDLLLTQQAQDGSWSSSICPEYATAMATIVLQVPNNCLPIFQR